MSFTACHQGPPHSALRQAVCREVGTRAACMSGPAVMTMTDGVCSCVSADTPAISSPLTWPSLPGLPSQPRVPEPNHTRYYHEKAQNSPQPFAPEFSHANQQSRADDLQTAP